MELDLLYITERIDHLSVVPQQHRRTELRLKLTGSGLDAALQTRTQLPGTAPPLFLDHTAPKQAQSELR